MKNTLIILISLLFISNKCDGDFGACDDKSAKNTNIKYFVDTRTGICFCEYWLGNYGFTSVPCDSLKKVTVKPF